MKTCRQEKTDRKPVWLMRQAGRYMREFREIRSKLGFLELCKNSQLASEVTVYAQEALGVDAAIIFADILLIFDALNLGLEYLKGEGPSIQKPCRAEEDFLKLPNIDVRESLAYVLEAIKLTRASLRSDIPLIGFAGAPFTLASYWIEGGSSRNYENTKLMMYRNSALWHALMDKLVCLTSDYLIAQIDAGSQALQIFDSWVGCLSPQDYKNFVLPHSKALIQSIKKVNSSVPIIHFGTSTSSLLELMKDAGADVIGLDWRVDLVEAREKLSNVVIQGNLDPCVLLSNDTNYIGREVDLILKQFSDSPGHIFNLGHGVLPGTDFMAAKWLVDYVHEYNPEYSS